MPPKYLEAMVNAYDLLHRGRIECYVNAEHDTLYPTPNPATIGRAYLPSEAVLPSSRNETYPISSQNSDTHLGDE